MLPYFNRSPCYERKITHTGYDYIFISPHLDDVVFSCSGAICTLQERGYRLLMVTLFAGDHPLPPFSILAQSFHRFWGVSEEAPYAGRQEEERRAMTLLNIDYAWLDWLEILYRAPHLTRQDTIRDAHVNPEQDAIFPSLCQWFIELSWLFPSARLVIPLGIGAHQDHLLTRQVACRIYDQHRLLFFEDFPYVALPPDEEEFLACVQGLTQFCLDITPFLNQRIQATLQYQSQIRLFYRPPGRVEDIIRAYTAQQSKQGQGTFAERYWAATPPEWDRHKSTRAVQ